MECFVVAVADSGKRLDVYLVGRYPGRSRRAIKAVIDAGSVRVGGKKARAGLILAAGDAVEVAAAPPGADDLRPTPAPDAPLEILYQDDVVVAIAKAAGMASHPLHAGELGTVASALVARFPECLSVGADPREAGLAHRLDAETSGVLLAARNQDVWLLLRQAFHAHRVAKRYLALCVGHQPAESGRVDAPIAHDASDRRRVVVCADDEAAVKRQAKPAHTSWRIVRRVGDLYWVSAEAETGRMHQVRAHLAFAGLPLAGDPLYGTGLPSPLGRHVLHAAELSLLHPLTGARLTISAPPPADVAALLGPA